MKKKYRTIEEITDRMLEISDIMTNDATLSDSAFKSLDAEFWSLDRQKKSGDIAAALSKPMGRLTEPDPTNRDSSMRVAAMSGARVTENNSLEIAKNFQAIAMKATAERTGGRVDGDIERRVRIMNSATTYSSEGTGADGGYAVPRDFRNEIVQKVNGEFSLLPLTNQVTTTSNEVTVLKDETPCFDNTKGPRVYWKAEAAQLTESKIALETTTLRLNKLTALLPMTNELVEDAPSLYNYLQRAVPQKFIHEFNRVFIEGTGVGEPLGILNSGSLVSIAKDSGQPSDTISFHEHREYGRPAVCALLQQCGVDRQRGCASAACTK